MNEIALLKVQFRMLVHSISLQSRGVRSRTTVGAQIYTNKVVMRRIITLYHLFFGHFSSSQSHNYILSFESSAEGSREDQGVRERERERVVRTSRSYSLHWDVRG